MSTASWPAPASLASRLRERWRNAALDTLILEAENAIGTGTSSRNSEVIHAGIYYPAGSQKARLCVAGREQLYRYCEERAVPHARCGKLIVATDAEQEPALASILANASACGAGDLTPLTAAEARARAQAAVHGRRPAVARHRHHRQPRPDACFAGRRRGARGHSASTPASSAAASRVGASFSTRSTAPAASALRSSPRASSTPPGLAPRRLPAHLTGSTRNSCRNFAMPRAIIFRSPAGRRSRGWSIPYPSRHRAGVPLPKA